MERGGRFTPPLAYGVALLLGLAFSAVLFYLAWYNSVRQLERSFSFEVARISESVGRGASTADSTLDNLAAFLEALGRLDESAFRKFVADLLPRHAFIHTVSFLPLSPEGRPDDDRRLDISRAGGSGLPAGFGFSADPGVDSALTVALESGQIIPTPPIDESGRFLLLRPAGGGVLALLVDPAGFVSPQSLTDQAISIRLYTFTGGVTGRQLVLQRQGRGREGEPLEVFSEVASFQFPGYSLRLELERPLYWADLDRPLLFTAALLGLGITLLMVALARAKELQARELRQRNLVIQRKVEEQTRELALARDQALEASRVKSDFLASMSHEIRTPLNAIIGMAELLSETELDEDQKRYVDAFARAGEALLSLVNDILDLSKIEAGQLELESIDFDLRELAEQALEIYALKTDEKGVELACDIAPDVPQRVRGDPARLRQIILNLIGNAIKFTDQGEIVLHIRRDPQGQEPEELLFSVTDTGIGIPPDKLESIFASFTQVDSSTTRKYGGTGLGLTISRKLVEKMDGRIWVESEPGRGSTFSFTVRLQPAESTADRGPVVTDHLEGKRALVVDDNETNRLIVRRTLEARGMQVDEAPDGESAIEAFHRARQAGRPYDAVLLDCRMPGMDGFSVAETLRREGGDVATMMMLTSSNLSTHLRRAQGIGLGAYLVKPVKQQDLLRGVAGLIGEQRVEVAGAVEPEEEGAEAARGKRILLVEDTPDNRLLIRAYLKRTPHQLDEAENGEIAVQKFRENRYDLVLMDVQMPVMDGYAATRAIREWEKAQGLEPTPVVALTAHAIKEDSDRSLEAGCTAHLTKPIKKATLLAAIEQYG